MFKNYRKGKSYLVALRYGFFRCYPDVTARVRELCAM